VRAGPEAWFAPPGGSVKASPRPKGALVLTILVIIVIVLAVVGLFTLVRGRA
jgi:hypothetical protein